MSNLPSVFFCPHCSKVSYTKRIDEVPSCCPDRAPEFVTEETARLALIGFRALVYRELPA